MEAKGIPWSLLGVIWGSSLSDFLGSLDVLLAAVGCLGCLRGSKGAPGTCLGGSGVISGIFWEIPGGLLAQFWDHFWCFLRYFVGLCFLIDF